MGLLNFIPGFKTLEGVGKGLGKLLTLDFKGAVQAVGKGLSQDWGLGIAALVVPGLQPLAMAHNMFPRLPGRGVSAGETWVDTIRYSGETAGSEISAVTVATYMVAGDTVVDGRSLLRITSEGTSEQTAKGAIAGQNFEQTVSGDLDGVYLWDMARGVMIHAFVDTDMRGTMNVAAAPFPLNIRMRGQSVMRLADGM